MGITAKASAVKVGQMRREENPNYTGNEEFNYFLAVAFFPIMNCGEILDYNRVVKDLNGMSSDEFLKYRVFENFEIKRENEPYHPTGKTHLWYVS